MRAREPPAVAWQPQPPGRPGSGGSSGHGRIRVEGERVDVLGGLALRLAAGRNRGRGTRPALLLMAAIAADAPSVADPAGSIGNVLARAVPTLLLDVVVLGITVILWQVATLLQVRRGAALLRWSMLLQGVGLVLDATWRPAAALLQALVILLGVLSMITTFVALCLFLAGVAAILRHIWPRPPRRRTRFAT